MIDENTGAGSRSEKLYTPGVVGTAALGLERYSAM